MVSGATRHERQASLAANPAAGVPAVGAGGIPSTATGDDDKPNMLRAGSALLFGAALECDSWAAAAAHEWMFCA